MPRKIFGVLLVLILSITFSSLTFAQRQTGSLAGKVVDEKNDPLPGVTVTLSGPVVQGTMSYVTTENGAYRYPALSPGEKFVLSCELPGFSTVIQKGISISLGKTTTIDVTMSQAALQKEVTVVAQTPTLDIKSTKTSLGITKELLESLPFNKNIFEALNAAPGLTQVYDRYTLSRGSDINSGGHTLDGVSMDDPGTRYPMMKVSTDAVEEMEVVLGGLPAEVGNAAGAYVNIVSPSGGNSFHGNANIYYFNKSFVDHNFTKEQLDTLRVGGSGTTDNGIIDTGFSLGGPILNNKLWFFISGGYLNKRQDVLGFPEQVSMSESTGMAKFTFKIAKNISLMFYTHYYSSLNRFSDADQWVTPDAVSTNTQGVLTFNSRLNWTLGKNAFVDFRVLRIARNTDFEVKTSTSHMIYDRGTEMTSGAASFNDFNKRRRPLDLQGSLTYFADNLLGGNHEFKTGAELEWGFQGRGSWGDAPIWEYKWFGSPYYYGNNEGTFRAWGWPSKRGDSEEKDDIFKFSFYVQDSWTLGRLTLNLGARYDSQHGSIPEQTAAEVPYWTWLNPDFFSKKTLSKLSNLIVWNNISPRLGIAIDLFGKGKTIAKAFYGRYYSTLAAGAWDLVKSTRTENFIDYNWVDNNWNGQIDPADTFTEIFRSGRGDWDPRLSIDPGLHAPFTDEFILGLDNELLSNFKLGINFVLRKSGNIVKAIDRNRNENWAATFTVNDPGYDGSFGTADDQKLTVYDRTSPFVDYYTKNLPEAWSKYRGLEFIFEKRMSNKWQLLGSVTWSRTWGTAQQGATPGLVSATPTGMAGFETPNFLINNEGNLDFDMPLVIKFQGSYQLPYGINLSGAFYSMSGLPFTRFVDVYAPLAGTYVRIMAEPRGTRRGPSTNRLNLRLEKEFTLGTGRLGVFIDAYNALNTAYVSTNTTIHGRIERDGSFVVSSRWKSISSTSVPRTFKFGLRYTF